MIAVALACAAGGCAGPATMSADADIPVGEAELDRGAMTLDEASVIVTPVMLRAGAMTLVAETGAPTVASLGAGDVLGHRLRWTEFVIAHDLGWANPALAGVVVTE